MLYRFGNIEIVLKFILLESMNDICHKVQIICKQKIGMRYLIMSRNMEMNTKNIRLNYELERTYLRKLYIENGFIDIKIISKKWLEIVKAE